MEIEEHPALLRSRQPFGEVRPDPPEFEAPGHRQRLAGDMRHIPVGEEVDLGGDRLRGVVGEDMHPAGEGAGCASAGPRGSLPGPRSRPRSARRSGRRRRPQPRSRGLRGEESRCGVGGENFRRREAEAAERLVDRDEGACVARPEGSPAVSRVGSRPAVASPSGSALPIACRDAFVEARRRVPLEVTPDRLPEAGLIEEGPRRPASREPFEHRAVPGHGRSSALTFDDEGNLHPLRGKAAGGPLRPLDQDRALVRGTRRARSRRSLRAATPGRGRNGRPSPVPGRRSGRA